MLSTVYSIKVNVLLEYLDLVTVLLEYIDQILTKPFYDVIHIMYHMFLF